MVASRKSRLPAVKSKRVAAERKPESDSDVDSNVPIDRRASEDRRETDRRARSEPVAVERRVVERRAKVNRRRQIDPTTCERDYSNEEIEFMNAMDEYKRRNGRMFPTCSEVLEVIRSLGYEKRPPMHEVASPVLDLPIVEMVSPTTA